ncbi:MAG: C4-type zinc ribbon domain-containing protein [Acidobacteria bacterium]|nr:C4-type zinc ribbon domain-containing protein [Acidobacteriota bacterium]
MSPDLERLIQLQQLASTIEEARQRIDSHPHQLADADARLAEATEHVEAAKGRLAASQGVRRELEKQAALYQGRVSKFKGQLSAVKTNREYQAMQHETATAEQEFSAAEEKVLEQMLDADLIAADIAKAEAALATRKKEVTAEKASLEEELATLQATMAEATVARETLLKTMDSGLVALFEQVAKVRKGIAVCATHDGLCSVCHVRLRPQVFQQVRQNDSIVQCDVCNRILYFVPPPAPPKAEPAAAPAQ